MPTQSARTAQKTPRPTPADAASARESALAIAGAALDKKAQEVEIIDVRGKVDYCDYVVVASGRSDRQVSAIAHHIESVLKTEHGQRCYGLEGVQHGQWVLMDFGDVVVHIFHHDLRGYYDIESLWLDAAHVEIPDEMYQGE